MARGKRFDKKNATSYSVVHRSHEDSLYYDNEASQHVLVEIPGRKDNPQPKRASGGPQQSARALSAAELARQLDESELKKIRNNEGLAAQYGIFFDDSNYDYMQHLRPIGKTNDAVFIEADNTKVKPAKPRAIEDLIKDALPSEQTRKATHEDLENIPSELQGFNPDMDPRLREVLEALEDEEYVENEPQGDDDIFADLLQSGQVESDEFYEDGDEHDDWDLDNHHVDFDEFDNSDYEPENIELDNPYGQGDAPEDVDSDVSNDGDGPRKAVNNAWERDFQRFKNTQKNQHNTWDSDDDSDDDASTAPAAEGADTVGDLPKIGKKKPKNKLRRRMGAMTDTSSFSMSSSAVFRTDGLTLLDDRYEQFSKRFERDDPEPPREFHMENERHDFEGMLDDFLENYELESGGRRLVKKDQRLNAIRDAAVSASKGKLADRKKKQDEMVRRLGGSFGKMSI